MTKGQRMDLYLFQNCCFFLKQWSHQCVEQRIVSRLLSIGVAKIQTLYFRKREVDMFLPRVQFLFGDNIGFHPGSRLPIECFGLGCEHDWFCSVTECLTMDVSCDFQLVYSFSCTMLMQFLSYFCLLGSGYFK